MPPNNQSPDGHETILLVDDEPTMRLITATVLERCGYIVLAADSGKAAIELWNKTKESIRLLLTDVDMPGMTGASWPEPYGGKSRS